MSRVYPDLRRTLVRGAPRGSTRPAVSFKAFLFSNVYNNKPQEDF
jgi:hypothetical protein